MAKVQGSLLILGVRSCQCYFSPSWVCYSNVPVKCYSSLWSGSRKQVLQLVGSANLEFKFLFSSHLDSFADTEGRALFNNNFVATLVNLVWQNIQYMLRSASLVLHVIAREGKSIVMSEPVFNIVLMRRILLEGGKIKMIPHEECLLLLPIKRKNVP